MGKRPVLTGGLDVDAGMLGSMLAGQGGRAVGCVVALVLLV